MTQGNQFELEALEPRILLSGAPAAAAAAPTGTQDPGAIVIAVTSDPQKISDSIQANQGDPSHDIFAGVEATSGTTKSSSESNGQNGDLPNSATAKEDSTAPVTESKSTSPTEGNTQEAPASSSSSNG